MAFWWARVAHACQRHAVNLGTDDERAAAARAAEFFADLIRSGWDSALANLNPVRHASREGLTIGDVVGMLDRIDLQPRTRANYANALRWWAARHLEIQPGPREFGRDVEAWRRRVHAVRIKNWHPGHPSRMLTRDWIPPPIGRLRSASESHAEP